MFEQLVNSRAVIMLRYTRRNIVILMAATAFSPPPLLGGGGGEDFLWAHLKSTVYESNPYTIQELKTNINHAVAATKITMLNPVYLNKIDVRSCVLTQEATTLSIFYDGSSFLHLATLLISVFTLRYGPGLLFRDPFCISAKCLYRKLFF